MPVIIPHTTSDSYFDVYNNHIAPKCTGGNTLEAADFPWVNIRHVYLSTYQSGSGSWKPALADAKRNGARNVYVLTGRHGDQYGGKIDTSGHMDAVEVQARDHYEQDFHLAKQLTSSQCKVTVIDVGSDKKYNSIQGLKALIDKLSRTGYVICAWCFSLLAMYWYTQALDTTKLQNMVVEKMNASITSIISDKWSWVH
jgi:hypothetical protein